MGMCRGPWTSRLVNGSPDPDDGFITIDTEEGGWIFGTHENSGGLVAGRCTEAACNLGALCHIDIKRRVRDGDNIIEYHYWGHFVRVVLPDGNERHVTLNGRYTSTIIGIVIDDVLQVQQNQSGDQRSQVSAEDIARLRDAVIFANGDWIGEKPIT